MLIFSVHVPKKEDAEKLNNMICEWLQGSHKFINNEIVVSPISCHFTYTEVTYNFDISIDDGCDGIYVAHINQYSIEQYLRWLAQTETTNE